MHQQNVGTLFVVATPIGNLEDMSFRAVRTLKECDLIAAEDTRHSQVLLRHFEICTALVSLHEHNEAKRCVTLIARILAGENVALISDAGTPLINDPGYRLVTAAKTAGVKVVPIPGACAAIAALSVGGLPTDSFLFVGFLPARAAAKKQRLADLKTAAATLIFYESPHRIVATLHAMQIVFGGSRQAVLARELTKKFETVYRADLAALGAWVEKNSNEQQGEMVILVAGATAEPTPSISASVDEILHILLKYLPRAQAVKVAKEIAGTNISKNALYSLMLMKNDRTTT